MNFQIKLFKLLYILPTYRKIIEKSFNETSIPQDFNRERFQSIVGHLTSPHYFSFSKEDNNSLSHPHNQSFHIEVMIHQKCVCHVFINNGVGLKYCLYYSAQTIGLL